MGEVILHPVTKDPKARRRFMAKEHKEATERQAQLMLIGAFISAALMMISLSLLTLVQ